MVFYKIFKGALPAAVNLFTPRTLTGDDNVLFRIWPDRKDTNITDGYTNSNLELRTDRNRPNSYHSSCTGDFIISRPKNGICFTNS